MAEMPVEKNQVFLQIVNILQVKGHDDNCI